MGYDNCTSSSAWQAEDPGPQLQPIFRLPLPRVGTEEEDQHLYVEEKNNICHINFLNIKYSECITLVSVLVKCSACSAPNVKEFTA